LSAALYYVADPMCSWCWGFAPELEAVRSALPPEVELRVLLGGLAPDDASPMDAETRRYVQSAWDEVEARTGARFNRDFWTRCAPRRSTYPACRAVLAAGAQDGDAAEGWAAGPRARGMFEAIQRAYYLEARNPSDRELLCELAGEISGLDPARFGRDLDSEDTEARLQRGFALRRSFGVRSFPSLVLVRGDAAEVVLRGYGRAEQVLAALE